MIIHNGKPCNRANYGGVRTKTQYIVVHYTSNKGDTAENNATYFYREALANPASAHYFVDENEIWQSVPENMIAYHCGAKTYKHPYCRNSNSVGVEICMNDKNGNVRQGSISKAVELVKWLMSLYGVAVENVIRHYDVTGKNCPEPMIKDESLWTNFKTRLTESEETEEMKTYKYIKDMPEYAQDVFTRLMKAGYINKNEDGSITVYDSSLQTVVILDRLCKGKLEKLPDMLATLGVL